MTITDSPDWTNPGGGSGSATIGQPTPLVATLVAGSDGTDVWAILTDSSGRLHPIMPDFYVGFGDAPPTITTILDAPTEGSLYLFGFDIAMKEGSTPGCWFLQEDASERMIASGYVGAPGTDHVDLGGLRIIGDLQLLTQVTPDYYTIRATVGP